MNTQRVRRQFLEYFKKRQHSVIPSSPVVPHDDPTLLFINAGMNQFKDVFLGRSARDYKRATTSQKCIRAGGKHNDLENVGHTRRHLTFFEMLGNFSFGDYFKSDAITFAWEVSTQVFGFDPERIWPTVFRDDDEAFELWTKYVPAQRISRLGEDTNFWAMGDTGPCGPCSELLFDRGSHYGNAQTPVEDIAGDRFLEFWNLVFMQYNRSPDSTIEPLPKPSIDTGAGIERVVGLQMNVESVFETDVLRSLIAQVEQISGVPYQGIDSANAPAFHVIADHLRCLSFAIADGAQPSNVDRGYVLRKILRRAVRYGRTLGLDRPFLADALPRLIETMGDDYPELRTAQTRIADLLTAEEETFLRTLRRGGNLLNQVIDRAKQLGEQITGDDAFKLKDTYGLPIDEVMLIAKDSALEVDLVRYQVLEEEARERSRKVHKGAQQVAAQNLFSEFAKTHKPCAFSGYDHLQANGRVLALVKDDQFVTSMTAGDSGMVILDNSPFYAEKGGQVGDTGYLHNSRCRFMVSDTQAPFKDVIAQVGTLSEGQLSLGDTLQAEVDGQRRQRIANNHTATHLLHWALQKVLGAHIKQAGSVVDPERLRFDFSHHKALTPEEIRQIEDLVNAKIRENQLVKAYEISYEEAQQRSDVKQFFGEKYGAHVRVIDIDYSKELCGGTHTSAVGTIGTLRVAKEGSIAAGIRRIEAVTGEEAEALARSNESLLNAIAVQLKTQPALIQERIGKLLDENKQLQIELQQAHASQRQGLVRDLMESAHQIHDVKIISSELSIPVADLRTCADEAMALLKSGVLVLGASAEGRCSLIASVSDDLVHRGVKAHDIVKHVAAVIEGSGGGKPNFAQAGGKAPDKLQEALKRANDYLRTHIKENKLS